jgi:hypothetical protein
MYGKRPVEQLLVPMEVILQQRLRSSFWTNRRVSQGWRQHVGQESYVVTRMTATVADRDDPFVFANAGFEQLEATLEWST